MYYIKKKMIIYLDIVFIENIIMNFIIIFTTGIVLKTTIKQWKMIIASGIGAIYTIVMYLNILPIYSNFFMKFILSVVIVYISFTPKKIKTLLKQLLIFYLISFIFGGCVFSLMFFVSPKLATMKNGVFVGAYPLKIALIGGIVSFIVIQISFKIIKTKLTKKNVIYDIEINLDNNSISVKALLDTGNLLKEPITGSPVVVVERSRLYSIFPATVLDNLEKIIGGDTSVLLSNNDNLNIISRFRMIPFTSLGKQNGLLLGIKVDYINVVIEENIKKIHNVIIGIYDKSFTKNDMYSAIFGLDILEGGKINECITNTKK